MQRKNKLIFAVSQIHRYNLAERNKKCGTTSCRKVTSTCKYRACANEQEE